jgi:LacI family transcriptional regulator
MVMAVGAIRALRELGLSVPEDVSLVALHDSELAGYLNPPVTTVWLPVRQMGSEAVDLLAGLIDGGPERSVVVPGAPVLIERESVRAR